MNKLINKIYDDVTRYMPSPNIINARARSATRRSLAVRARKPLQAVEVKMSCLYGLPARSFETEEVESLSARSRRKLKI